MSSRSWEEALHPRDHGRFSSKPGTSGHMPAVNVSRAHTNGVANPARAKADEPKKPADWKKIPAFKGTRGQAIHQLEELKWSANGKDQERINQQLLHHLYNGEPFNDVYAQAASPRFALTDPRVHQKVQDIFSSLFDGDDRHTGPLEKNPERLKAKLGGQPHSEAFHSHLETRRLVAENTGDPSHARQHQAAKNVSDLAKKYGGTAIRGEEVKPGDRVVVAKDLRGSHEEKTVKWSDQNEIRFQDGSRTTVHGNVVRLDR